MNVEVKGLDEIVRNFDFADETVKKHFTVAVRIATMLLHGSLMRGGYVPVLTGTMKSSIRPTILPLTATIAPHVKYAIYVHEGTKFMTGRPFMEWAVEREGKAVLQTFEDAAEKVTKELTK